jgi:hypothetical protein
MLDQLPGETCSVEKLGMKAMGLLTSAALIVGLGEIRIHRQDFDGGNLETDLPAPTLSRESKAPKNPGQTHNPCRSEPAREKPKSTLGCQI